jgi:hypothetical protein
MGYYCHECRQDISEDDYFFSMNRYHVALCRTHQAGRSKPGSTQSLQELVRERHRDELQKDLPKLVTVKDWIAADFETWDKVLNDAGKERYAVKGGGEKKKEIKK